MSEMEIKANSDKAWKKFENTIKGLDVEEKMKSKWFAMAQTCTQRNGAKLLRR